jgi:hypothetical protein
MAEISASHSCAVRRRMNGAPGMLLVFELLVKQMEQRVFFRL